MVEKSLGKIQGISIGFGGYDDAMFGVSVSLGSGRWGILDFRGTWGFDPSKGAKWTKAEQITHWGETMEWLKNLVKDANVLSVGARRPDGDARAAGMVQGASSKKAI